MDNNNAMAEACDKLCDHYCKYTEQYFSQYKDPDDAIEHQEAEVCKGCPLMTILDGCATALSNISQAVQVTRCKDYTSYLKPMGICQLYSTDGCHFIKKETDFCSCAERRLDASE